MKLIGFAFSGRWLRENVSNSALLARSGTCIASENELWY